MEILKSGKSWCRQGTNKKHNNIMKEATNNIPQHWEIKAIREVCTINPKIPDNDKIAKETEIQFIPMKLVEETINKVHLSEIRKYGEVLKGSYTPFINGDVIFAKVTPCMENGKVAVVQDLKNGIGFGSSEFHVLRCSSEVLNNYIFHFIVQDKFRREAENAMTGAVGLRRVPKKFIEDYPIPLPPLPEQVAIVNKIEELFSELENGKQQLLTAQQQLKVYRQSLLKAAFEGRLTNENLKDGELPEGWMWVKLGDVCNKIGDIDHKMPKQVNEGYPYVSTKDFTNNLKISFDNVKYISREDYLNLARKIKPEKGDIIFPRYGTIGKNILITFDKEFIVSYSCAVIKPNHKLVLSKYVYLYSLSPKITDEIRKYTVETTQANVGIASIKIFQFPLPPLPVQQAIVEILERKLTVCDKLEEMISESLKQTETLRQSILKKAFEGKLDLDLLDYHDTESLAKTKSRKS